MITDAEKIVFTAVQWRELERILANHKTLVAKEISRDGYGDPKAYRYSLVDGSSIVFEVKSDAWGFGIHADLVAEAQELLDQRFEMEDDTAPNAKFIIPNKYSELEAYHESTGIVVPGHREIDDDLER